ncbi:MAG: hypothetical protein ISS91_04855 [Candidatus Omnitrophica bacterium]|nr:hypothetical protein [Candidatus Omnitrophota bacterium]
MNKVLAFLILCVAILCPSGIASAEEGVFVYDAAGKRDPFVPLIGVTAKGAESISDIISIEDVTLQGIATNAAGQKVAIINDEMIKEGQIIGRVELKKVLSQSMVLLIDGVEYRINLYKED